MPFFTSYPHHIVQTDLLIYAQIQPLTHTNIQIYDEENWRAVYRTSHLPLIGDRPESKVRLPVIILTLTHSE